MSTNVLSDPGPPTDPSDPDGVPVSTDLAAAGEGASAARLATALAPMWNGRRADLCQRFVEQLVAEAAEQRAAADPSGFVPQVDWSTIWSAAEGAESAEAAFGRVVLAAHRVASEIPQLAAPQWPSEPTAPPEAAATGTLDAPPASPVQPPFDIGEDGSPVIEAPAPPSFTAESPVIEAPAPPSFTAESPVIEAPAPPAFTAESPVIDVAPHRSPFFDYEPAGAPTVPRAQVPPVAPAPFEPPTVGVPAMEAPAMETPAPFVSAPEAPAPAVPVVAEPTIAGPPGEVPVLGAPASTAWAPAGQAPAPVVPSIGVPSPGAPTSVEGPGERAAFEQVQLAPDVPATGAAWELPPPVLADEHPAPPTRQVVKRRRRLFTFFGWVQNIGLILLLFAAWQLWGTGLSQHRAQQSLAAQFAAEVHNAAGHATKSGSTTPTTLAALGANLPAPRVGSVIAHIEVPAVGINQYVVEGSSTAQLDVGPGHYIGTALPGQAGNVAIAGHRTTYGAPFNHLGQVVAGDSILLTTTTGEQLTYVVSKPWVAVPPSDTAILNYFGDNRITLTTCNPEFSATQRLIVVGVLKAIGSTPAPAPSTGTPVAVAVAASVTAGWNFGGLPAVLGVAVVLALLGFFYRRIVALLGRSKGRLVPWLVLAPVWAVGLVALFVATTHFLPATL